MNTYTVSDQNFLTQLYDIAKMHDHPIIDKAKHLFPKYLKRIYQEVPLTLVHHDYHAKNLLIQGNDILPIDWSDAYLSPHLSDLYCLIQEAQSRCGLSEHAILIAYYEEVGTDALSFDELKHQVNIGGLCWLIHTLRWLTHGGTKMIPGSEKWIPDLMTDMGLLIEVIYLNL